MPVSIFRPRRTGWGFSAIRWLTHFAGHAHASLADAGPEMAATWPFPVAAAELGPARAGSEPGGDCRGLNVDLRTNRPAGGGPRPSSHRWPSDWARANTLVRPPKGAWLGPTPMLEAFWPPGRPAERSQGAGAGHAAAVPGRGGGLVERNLEVNRSGRPRPPTAPPSSQAAGLGPQLRGLNWTSELAAAGPLPQPIGSLNTTPGGHGGLTLAAGLTAELEACAPRPLSYDLIYTPRRVRLLRSRGPPLAAQSLDAWRLGAAGSRSATGLWFASLLCRGACETALSGAGEQLAGNGLRRLRTVQSL